MKATELPEDPRPTLKAFGRRIAVRTAWDTPALPARQKAALRKIAAGVRRSRRTGGCVLFAGPDGTIKAKAAQVLARELGLGLYRVNLGAIFSKYIGETEKNLNQLFAAAEVARAVLFFDEADALFGKRSEIQDAHDRYANQEVSYLLQRLESQPGLVILASNLKSNSDDAFIRRLRFVVDFPPTKP